MSCGIFLLLAALGVTLYKYYHSVRFFEHFIGHTRTGYIKYRHSDGSIIDINQGLIDLLELTVNRKSVIGKDVKEFFIVDEEQGGIKEQLVKGTEGKQKMHFQTLEGKEKWISYTAYPQRDPYSGQVMIRTFIEDMTGEEEATQKMKETEVRYEKLFKHSGDMVILYDLKERNIEEINPITEIITGFRNNELTGSPFEELIHPAYRGEVQEKHEEMLIKGGANVRAVIVCKEGRYKEVWLTFSIVQIKGKKIVMAVIKDISEMVKEKEEQKKIREELENIRDASLEREERIKELREELNKAKRQIDGFMEEKEQ